MRRLADRFCDAVAQCRSVKDLAPLLNETARELGFTYFALLHHASLADTKTDLIRVDNYPEDWAAELTAHALWRYDPVHQACRHACVAFEWRELPRLTSLGRRQKWILSRSRHFGIGPGLTIPVNIPGEPAASCSFAVRAGDEFPYGRTSCAELIGVHAFNAARLIRHLPRPIAPPHLSRREIQCLRLVAAGKTDREIGIILGISPETARQYVKQARAAYDVVTRTQLVVAGLRDDWISFDEALDPRRPL